MTIWRAFLVLLSRRSFCTLHSALCILHSAFNPPLRSLARYVQKTYKKYAKNKNPPKNRASATQKNRKFKTYKILRFLCNLYKKKKTNPKPPFFVQIVIFQALTPLFQCRANYFFEQISSLSYTNRA